MSTRKIDFGEGVTWSAFPNEHWIGMAGNPNFPDYLRILFVAYGRHTANGHTNLERGELAYFLVRKNGTLPDRRTVRRAVQESIRLEYLDDASSLLCLVVPSHDMQGGKGDPSARCRRDHTKRTATNDGNGWRRSETNDGNETGRSETNDGNGMRRSTLSPSISSTTPTGSVPARALHAVPDASREAI